MGFFRRQKLKKQELEWDDPGFGVRRNKNGTEVFIAKICRNGKQKWYTIGPVDLIKTEDARNLVRRMKRYAASGEDPQELLKSFIRSEGASVASGITFGRFAEIYIENYAKVYKKSWKKDEQRIKLYLKKWKDRRLTDITRQDVADIHGKIGTTKTKMKNRKATTGRTYAANRLVETLGSMWKQAIIMEYLPASTPKWTFGIRKFAEVKRKNKLTKADMPKIRDGIDKHPIKRNRQAFHLIMMMGLRHMECCTLKWSYFDFEERVLEIPVTKNGEGHRLPISSAAARLLHSIRRFKDCDWVFPSVRDKSKHLPHLSKAWQKIRKQAGLEHITIHDLRRTFGCFILKQTGDKEMVRDLLNHSDEQVASVYAFYDIDDLAPVMEKHSDAMAHFLGLAGDSESA